MYAGDWAGEEGSKQQAVRIGAVAASNPGSAGKVVVAEMVALLLE